MNRGALLSLCLEQMTDANGSLSVTHEELVSGVELSLVNPEEAELPEVRVARNVEDASEQRLVSVVGVDERLFVVAFADEERTPVAFGRAWEIAHDDVEQLVHPDSAQRVRETDGDDVRLIHGALERLVKRLVVGLLAVEVALHERIVDFDGSIEQLGVETGNRAEVAFARPVQ